MKKSNVEWLGEIPKSWEMERAKFNFSQSLERGNKTPELLAATQKYGMYPQRLLEGVVQVMAGTDLQQFKTVHKDDFVMSLRSFQGGFERSDYEGVCSPAYQVFRSNERYDKNWLKWFFKSDMFIDAMNALTVGIREGRNIKYDDFANSILPLPPLPEQSAIASYLDEKCAAIDEIIAEAKATIDEYKSWKASVIFEAVTKGLNPDAEMKDSGVEWIGMIPKDWKVISLRYLGKCQNGISKDGEAFGSGFPFVSYTDVYKNIVLPGEASRLVESTEDERERYSVKYGDIFFTRTSETIEEIGFSSVCLKTIDNATFAGFLIRFRPTNNKLYPEYSKYYFRSELQRRYFVKEMTLVTRASLGQELLKSMPVILPPFETQQKIAAYLDEKCATIDGVIAEKEALIGELESYKKSLIFETVTGKRRVAI